MYHGSVFLTIAILVPLSFTKPQYRCKNPEEKCVEHKSCANVHTVLMSGGTFESCGVQNFVPTICCKNIINTTTPTRVPPSQSPPIPPKPLSPTQPASVSPVKRPSIANSRNATAIVLNNCKKYETYKYTYLWEPANLPGKSGSWKKKSDCVPIYTLITNGTQAEPKEYPHMALIGFGKTLNEVEWLCGGSLISEKFVMSAAHCGKTSIQGEPRWVKLGDLNITSNADDAKPAVYSIIKIHDHPLYNKNLHFHDISLFELNSTVTMNPYVRPACLSTSTTNPVGSKGSITGWGLIGTVERRSNHLLKASIFNVEDWRCINRFTSDGYNSTTMICAGDLQTGKDTCPGDSGGPLQSFGAVSCMWDIFGITSYGHGICGSNEEPSMYTKVVFYLDWIQSIVWPV